MRRYGIVVAIFAMFSSNYVNRSLAGTLYHVTDLGVPPDGGNVYAYQVNASGQVVGFSDDPQGTYHPYLWSSGTGFQDVLGASGVNSLNGDLTSINNTGDAVGHIYSSTVIHAVLWTQSGGVTILDPVPANFSSAWFVNANDQVVGQRRIYPFSNFNPPLAFLWSTSTGMKSLATLRGTLESEANCINDAGQIVGYSDIASGRHATLWTAGGSVQDLGTLPGNLDSIAFAIDSSGQVVGSSFTQNKVFPHAFLWTAAGGMQDLGVLPGASGSYATAINSSGEIVGKANTSLGGPFNSAFLWTNATGMQNLNSLLDASSAGWKLNLADWINDSGEIVCDAIPPGGTFQHVVLLTPVPEPSSASILIIGCLALARAGFRRFSSGSRVAA
jgi:probable HAF family extracellular repeat protein